ncbi:MAG: CoA ester lyase [Propioniciclava sp.]|jgi:citrate lyase subunit beta / citryl-CoA lyase
MPATPRPARVRRTVLAVPGSSDRFIAKARTLAVDTLFLDLEDAVAPAVKQESRQRIVDALLDPAGFAAPTVTVRVNDWSTPWTFRDVEVVVGGAGAKIDCVLLPKVTSAAQVVALDLLLTQVEQERGLVVGGIGIEAQIEEARGLIHVNEIAASSPRLETLVYGPGDFMAAMGMAGLNVGAQPGGYPADAFHYVMMAILVAARAHGLQAIDGPFVAIRDTAGFEVAARRAAALGYDGKWVLHPDQVEAGTRIFSPDPADLARARRILDAYAAAGTREGGARGAIVVDDEMVDEAGVKLAAAIVARGGAVSSAAGKEQA